MIEAKLYEQPQVVVYADLEWGVTSHGDRPSTRISVGTVITTGPRAALRHPPGSHYTPPLCALRALDNSQLCQHFQALRLS